MKATKPNNRPSLQQMHQQLKRKYPRSFALEMVMMLRKKGIRCNRQKVYRFFNGTDRVDRAIYLEAAKELLL